LIRREGIAMAGTSLDVRTSMAEVDGLLLVSLPSELSDAVLQRIVRDVSQRVTESGIDGVILNLSAVRLLDLSEFEMVRHLVRTNALLGVRTVLVGIRPGIAAYLCEMHDQHARPDFPCRHGGRPCGVPAHRPCNSLIAAATASAGALMCRSPRFQCSAPITIPASRPWIVRRSER